MAHTKLIIGICFHLFYPVIAFTQNFKAELPGNDTTLYFHQVNEQVYKLCSVKIFVYPKPKPFGFITRLPKDLSGMAGSLVNEKSIMPVLWVASSTTALLFFDQDIYDRVTRFSKNIHLDPTEKNVNLLSIRLGKKSTTLIKLPGNINTAFYQLGQGAPPLLIAGGLFLYSKIKNDYRALSTASQLAEAFILMGVSSQVIKRITGRETPGASTKPGGKWRPFPSFSDFQQQTPSYDAFPSGHLATMMSSVTILAQNYPEKKWIGPVGYALTGLVGFAMINNGVHWSSDYPLAIGMGYLCGRQLVKNSRKEINKAKSKQTGNLSFSISHVNGKIMPGLLYKF